AHQRGRRGQVCPLDPERLRPCSVQADDSVPGGVSEQVPVGGECPMRCFCWSHLEQALPGIDLVNNRGLLYDGVWSTSGIRPIACSQSEGGTVVSHSKKFHAVPAGGAPGGELFLMEHLSMQINHNPARAFDDEGSAVIE